MLACKKKVIQATIIIFYPHYFVLFFCYFRRLIFTADPKWPSVTVSGDLPQLNLYFSEIKVCHPPLVEIRFLSKFQNFIMLVYCVYESANTRLVSLQVQTMWKCMANLWSKNATTTQPSDESIDSPSNLLLNQSKFFYAPFEPCKIFHHTYRPSIGISLVKLRYLASVGSGNRSNKQEKFNSLPKRYNKIRRLNQTLFVGGKRASLE